MLVVDVELAERDGTVVCEPAAHRVGDGFGGLVDLFEHEVRKAALLGLAHVPVDLDELGLHSDAIEARDFRAERRDGCDLTLAGPEVALGVRDDRRDVRGDPGLALAKAAAPRGAAWAPRSPRADSSGGAHSHGRA